MVILALIPIAYIFRMKVWRHDSTAVRPKTSSAQFPVLDQLGESLLSLSAMLSQLEGSLAAAQTPSMSSIGRPVQRDEIAQGKIARELRNYRREAEELKEVLRLVLSKHNKMPSIHRSIVVGDRRTTDLGDRALEDVRTPAYLVKNAAAHKSVKYRPKARTSHKQHGIRGTAEMTGMHAIRAGHAVKRTKTPPWIVETHERTPD